MSDHLDSVNMFLISLTILPQKQHVDLPRFIQKVADIFSNLSNKANIVYQFKVFGEPKLIFIVSISNTTDLERTFATLWQQGSVQVECQPVVSYENFARSIKVAENLAQPSKDRLANDRLYWLDFDVGYLGKTTEKLIKIWKKEAKAVFTARHKGVSIELYKCVAERKIHAFMNAPTPGYLDTLSLQLPLIIENGANVQLKCKALQFLENYISLMASDPI